MKPSVQGNRIAVAIEGQKIFELFDFYPQSGHLTFRRLYPAGDDGDKVSPLHGAFGVEFSTSGNFLYGSTREGGYIYQWPQSAGASDKLIVLGNFPEIECGEMELAPDGKIYVALKGQDYLPAINSPNREDCRYDNRGKSVRLIKNTIPPEGGRSGYGLPSMLPLDRKIEPFCFQGTCVGGKTLLYIPNYLYSTPRYFFYIYKEDKGNPLIIQVKDGWAEIDLKEPTYYRIQLRTMTSTKIDTISRYIWIYPLPVVDIYPKDEDYNHNLCKGQEIPLDAGYGAFYEWEFSWLQDRARVIIVNNEPEQVYRLWVKDYQGCTNQDFFSIYPLESPSVIGSSTPAFCQGKKGSAIATPQYGRIEDYTYRWDNYPDETSNVLSDLGKGDYTVHVINRNGCETQVIIHVEDAGTDVKILSSTDQPVCPGISITLTVEGAIEMEWIYPLGKSGLVIQDTPQQTTTYSGIATVLVGTETCPYPISKTIEVNDVVKPDLGGDKTPCEGIPIRLDGGNGYRTYQWSNGAIGQFINISLTIPALTLRAEDINGCVSESDPISITFQPAPPVSLGQDTSRCSTDPIILTSSYPYDPSALYSWNNGESSGYEYTATKTGDFVLEVNKNGCLNSDTVHVQLNDPNELIITEVNKKDISCFNEGNGRIEVIASGDGRVFTYSIDDGINYFDNNGVFENLVPGKYFINVLEDGVCHKRWPSGIDINQPEELMLKVCTEHPSGKDTNDGTITISHSGGTPPFELQINGQTINDTKIANLRNGDYVLTISDANGCQEPKAVVLNHESRLYISSNQNSPVCPGSQVVIEVFNANSPIWVERPDLVGSKITVYPLVSTTYHVRSSSEDNLCESEAYINIDVRPDFEIGIGTVKDNTCFLSSNGSIEILTNPSGNYEYSINYQPWQQSGIFTDLPAGIDYSIRVRDQFQCQKALTGDVIISQPDEIQVKYYPNKFPSCSSCPDGEILIEVTGGNPPYVLTLDGGGIGINIRDLGEGKFSISDLDEGLYKFKLNVIDKNDCNQSIEIEVELTNEIPNVITPNGDQVNDLWTIPLLESKENWQVLVFDINGRRVFLSDPNHPVPSKYYDPWDGTYEGKEVPSGTYFYIIDIKDGSRQRTGSLTIVREK